MGTQFCSVPLEGGRCGRPLDGRGACPRCDHPSPPAAAWGSVVRLLPADYFSTRPPDVGTALTVTSDTDNRPTTWIMRTADARRIAPALQRWGLRVQAADHRGPGWSS